MRCLGVVVGTAWLHATRQFLDTSVFLGGNIMIQIRMQQGISQDAWIIRQAFFSCVHKEGDFEPICIKLSTSNTKKGPPHLSCELTPNR